MSGVAREQRHLRGHRCPVCDGADGDPRGQGKRCSGFTSADGDWTHCSREEHAGAIDQNDAGLFAHRMRGACKCGLTHGSELRAVSDVEAVYPYTDERGSVLFEVVRKTGKRFVQRRPDGAGGYVYKLEGVRRVLFGLPALVDDDVDRTVHICEGEKDVAALKARGFLATCNPGGAGKWSAVATLARDVLRGRDVVIVADADDVGRKHARDIEGSLRGVVRSLRVVEPPAPLKDVSDLLNAGRTLDELVAMDSATAPVGDEPQNADATLAPTVDAPLQGLTRLALVAILGRQTILDLAAKPVVYLWQDIAIAGIIVVIAGGPGGGKTTLLFLILAARLNLGEPVDLLGRRITPAASGRFVVLIEGEHGPTSTMRKLVKSLRLLSIGDEALDRVIVVARKSVRVGSIEWDEIGKLVAAGLVSDIALDTLARVAPADANDEQAQVAVFDVIANTIDLAPSEETKPVVWCVAHTRKGAGDDLEGVSGSTQRVGQADTVLMVQPERRDGRVISSKVTFAKLREEPEEYPTPVEYTVTADSVVVVAAAQDTDKRPVEDRIVARLALGPQTKNALKSALGRNTAQVEEAISNLFAAKRIRSVDVSIRGKAVKAFSLREGSESGRTLGGLDGSPDFAGSGQTQS